MMPITTFSELDTKLGEIVQVVGVYTEINGAQRPGKYYPSGRACLRLEDGDSVTLEIQDAGIRPKAEMELLRDKKVIVSGKYVGWKTLWGDGTQASIVSHCLVEITELKAI
jgi:hypothetical protein